MTKSSATITVKIMFNTFIEASHQVTELMRFHDVEQVNDKTSLLYTLITDNHPLFIKLHQDIERVDISDEMKFFMNNRIAFITNIIVDRIIKHFNLENDLMENKPIDIKINGSLYKDIQLMSRFEFEKLEYDVEQILRMSNFTDKTINHNDESYHLTESTMFDRTKLLVFLIKKLRLVNHYSQTIEKRSSAKYILNKFEDVSSIRCLVILGYLVTKVAYSLAKANSSFDYVGIKEAKLSMIKSKFEELTSLGSVSIANTICCFGNYEFMKHAVENKDGSSSQDTRTLLFNLLVIAKITNKLFN
jgi:hypothetical protein